MVQQAINDTKVAAEKLGKIHQEASDALGLN
jgi:hypothetical protein